MAPYKQVKKTVSIATGEMSRARIQSREFNFLKESQLLKELDEQECINVWEKVEPVINFHKKGEIIVNQGYECSHIGIIVEGIACSEKYHIDGLRQIMRKYNRQNLLCIEAAFSYSSTSPVTIIAKSPCVVMWISHLKLVKSQLLSPEIKNKIYKNIMYEMANENIRLMYKSDVLAHRALRDRVMTYLSIISEKRKSSAIKLNMNQVEFANYLCVNRSALSAELNAMRRDGLISYKKDKYTIHVRPNQD